MVTNKLSEGELRSVPSISESRYTIKSGLKSCHRRPKTNKASRKNMYSRHSTGEIHRIYGEKEEAGALLQTYIASFAYLICIIGYE